MKRVIRNNTKSRMKVLLMLFLIQLLFLFYAVFRGKSQIYLQIAAVIIPCSLIACLIADKIKADKYLIIWTTILINCGFMIQAMTNASSDVQKSLIKCLIAVGAAFLAAVVFWFAGPFLATDKGMFFIILVHFLLGALMIVMGQMVGSEESQGAILNLAVGTETVQPFEVVKLTYIFVMASLLCKKECYEKKVLGLNRELFAVLFTLLTAGMLILCKELGTLLVILLSGCAMFFVYAKRKIPLRYLLILAAAAVTAGIAVVVFFHEGIPLLDKVYNRFSCMINPELTANTTGYQYLHIKKSIAIGGLFGPDTSRYITTLSNESNDLIFCKLVQTCGIVMGTLVIGVFFLFFREGNKIADFEFESYFSGLARGITYLIVFESLIHFGYSVQLLPITGIPLYFMSCGFSSLTMGLVMVAFLVVISTNMLERRWEYDYKKRGRERHCFRSGTPNWT